MESTASSLTSVSLVEHQHLTEMHAALKRKLLEAHKKDANGRMGSVRIAILGLVVGENYERACEDLRSYVEARTQFPEFQERSRRYVEHGCDLIQAIQTKRSFPGLGSLSLAKQQEIHEKVLEHFEELKQILRQIGRVEREQRMNDIRSTVWVLRTLTQVVALVLAFAFMVDLYDGMFTALLQVVDVYVNQATIWLVAMVPL